MAETSQTYKTKVGIEQDAETIFVREDGNLKFYDTDFTGQELKDMLYTNNQKTEILTSGGKLSTVANLTPGVYYLRLSAGASNASAWLTSCSAGDEVKVFLREYSTESVLSVFISMSGCSLVGTHYSDLSSISLHTSDASAGWIVFHCYTAGEWSIMEKSGAHLIVEQSIS